MTAETRTVTEDEAGIRLDRYLRRHYPGLTQGVIQKSCRTGDIRVEGQRAEAGQRLAPGQSVRLRLAPAPAARAAPPADPRRRAELAGLILYADDQLIVLDKPFGLPVQGGPGITRHLDGMLDLLAEGGDRPRLVHRLDRDTTGVLLLARTPGVAARLAAAFRGRAVGKTYWALIAGRAPQPEGRIDLPLRRLPGQGAERGARSAAAHPDDPEAAHAVTDYRTLDHAGRRITWLELRPQTGRTHQLRVHCAALGAPIVGDSKYGDPDQVMVAALEEKLYLHARALTLPHPAGGVLEVTAPPPPHFRAGLAALGFTLPPTPPPRRGG